MANECIPLFQDGDELTVHASVALTGKKFCAISGNAQPGFGNQGLAPDPLVAGQGGNIVVGLPAAGGRVFGVVQRDCPAGSKVGVWRDRTTIVPITAAAAIAAFQEVQVDATGAVIPLAAGVAVGYAVDGAASGADAYISLY